MYSNCDFQPFDGKFRCSKCGIIVTRSGRKRCSGTIEALIEEDDSIKTIQVTMLWDDSIFYNGVRIYPSADGIYTYGDKMIIIENLM